MQSLVQIPAEATGEFRVLCRLHRFKKASWQYDRKLFASQRLVAYWMRS
jgi:hypothetical protein